MYNVLEIRLSDNSIVVEDDKNTGIEEIIQSELSLSSNGLPMYCYDIDEGYLMQYTGCTDFNGKDVYEGDLIMWYYNSIDNRIGLPDELLQKLGIQQGGVENLKSEKYEILEVVFDGGIFGVMSGFGINPLSLIGKYEVIGNIHENKEYLS